jgi:uncharacterized protein (TIGR03437 family)
MVISAELQAGSVGVYVVRIMVPAGLDAGDSIPVQFTVKEQVSNQVTIAVH